MLSLKRAHSRKQFRDLVTWKIFDYGRRNLSVCSSITSRSFGQIKAVSSVRRYTGGTSKAAILIIDVASVAPPLSLLIYTSGRNAYCKCKIASESRRRRRFVRAWLRPQMVENESDKLIRKDFSEMTVEGVEYDFFIFLLY